MNNVTKKIINLRLLFTKNGMKRGKYLKNKNIFEEFGDNVWWQPYKIPAQPKLVKIGNNVRIATGVLFLEHDVFGGLLNIKYNTIEVGDNTFVRGGGYYFI